MKKQLIGRDKEISFLTTGFSQAGNLRTALVTGARGMGKSSLLQKIEQNLTSRERAHICFSPQAEDLSSPLDFCASLTRNVRSSSESMGNALHDFGRAWGRKAVSFDREVAQLDGNEEEWVVKLFKSWVQTLESTLKEHAISKDGITTVLIVDNLGKYSDASLGWLTTPFNEAIRASTLFKRTRFLFSSTNDGTREENFFDKFGFERVQRFPLSFLSPAQCEKLSSLHGFQGMAGSELREITDGNPLKLLNIFNKPTSLQTTKGPMMTDKKKKALPHFSDFSEEEFNHLLFASYFQRVNRYNLEFLCSPRDAAFSYNWLKRQKEIAQQQPDGDLVLRQEIRDQIQEFHRQDKPEEAERINVIATVVDTFTAAFPNPEHHWIPVNLQALDSFTKDLCRNLFSESELPEVLAFLENHGEQFNSSGKHFSLTSDNKILTQRFIEVGGKGYRDDFVQRALSQWELDSKAAEERHRQAEQEQLNLSEEAADIEKQVEGLILFKEKIMDDFNNPDKSPLKARRVYSFSSNKFFVFLGIGTIAISLFSDSFGSIYAACGLLLALLGFFWPNMDIRKPMSADGGPGPNLAIETQQRSLDHRIKGLISRASSIKENLRNMSQELENLGEGLEAPYVSES
jgi:hypothetical protein